MVNIAKDAKTLVESSTEDEIKKYCKDHPKHEAFVTFAASYFTPIVRRDSIVMVEEQVPTTIATTSSPATGTHGASNDITNANMSTPVPTTAPENEITETKVMTEAPASTPYGKAAMNASSGEASSSPVPGRYGKINGVHTSDSEDEAKDSSTTSVEVDVASKAPEMLGRLTATFYDINGMLVGIHQKEVQVPVMATMTIASRSPTYNPSELIAAINGLAQSMVERANGNGSGAGAPHLVSYEESDDEEL
jgi:hypothetical protein